MIVRRGQIVDEAFFVYCQRDGRRDKAVLETDDDPLVQTGFQHCDDFIPSHA